MSRLSDKTAIITGASSGIGRGIAKRFDEEGANIVVADIRRGPRLDGEPTDEIVDNGIYVETDVTDVSAIEDLVEKTVDEFGSLDVIVNNAGAAPEGGTIEDVTEEDYDKTLDIDLKSVYFCCKEAVKQMKEQSDGGSIINMSSIGGLVALPGGTTTYTTSKGGVTQLTRDLAVEVGDEGIRVNAINPGVIETAMTTEDSKLIKVVEELVPLGRPGQPEDIANAAVFLASDESSYVTGDNFVVDGGYTAR
ncbi:MAG: SDR family NAD(P)-dependent oxidoreductase [Halobacteria archaeon]